MTLALALTWLLAGCATMPAGPQLGQLPSLSATATGLEARRLAVRSLSMRGDMMVEAPTGDLSGDTLIHAAYPDRLRADVTDPLGRPALRLVVDGPRFTMLVYGEGKAYVGSASRRNLARFVGVGLLPTEIYAILSGGLPLLGGLRGEVSLAEDRGWARLQLTAEGGRVVEGMVFSLADYAVREAWVGQGVWPQGQGLECRFGRLQPRLGSRYPLLIEVADPSGRRLTLDNDELVLNPALDGRLFEASVPAGLEVVRLP